MDFLKKAFSFFAPNQVSCN